jgi:hypothetical protein
MEPSRFSRCNVKNSRESDSWDKRKGLLRDALELAKTEIFFCQSGSVAKKTNEPDHLEGAMKWIRQKVPI